MAGGLTQPRRLPRNLQASIAGRLQNIAREANHPYHYVVERYVQERFLYRLSTGQHCDRFVLKGGLLLTALTSTFLRATRDIDVRAYAENDIEATRTLITEALAHEVPEDGVTYNVGAMQIERILSGDDEPGLRITIPALLGRQRARVQMDMGFGDAVVLPAIAMEYPVLLTDQPAPTLRAYSLENMIAEKLEAIASLGVTNTRFKDFDDLFELASRRDFVCSALWNAVRSTFGRRGTQLEALLPALARDNATPARGAAHRANRARLHARGAFSFEQCLQSVTAFADGVVRYDEDGLQRQWSHEGQTWSRL